MSNELYYRGSSTYEVAVKNKLDALERSGTRNAAAMMAGLRNMEYGIRSDIRESTYAIVASQEMLAQTYKQGFDSVNNTLDLGFEKMAFGMNNIANGMNDIANSISAMSDAICSKLDELHGIMSNPRLTAARELFRRAADNFEKGYFEEALEDCKQAVEKEKTDFISWFLLGQIYLYGAGKFSNVIDLQKAEESLQNAAKYIDSDIGTSTEADSLASQIYYELGHTQLMISNDLLVEGKNQESQEKLEKAEKATRESFKIDSTKLEAIYENAKELHFLGKDDECLKLLETLIYSEKGYALKASCDKNFESIWGKIDEVIKGIRDSRVKVVKRDLEDLNNSVQNGISANYSDKWTLEFKGIKFIIDSILSVIDNKYFFYVTDIQDQKLPELSEKVEDAHKLGREEKERREREEAEKQRKIEERERKEKEEREERERQIKEYERREAKLNKDTYNGSVVFMVLTGLIMIAELYFALHNYENQDNRDLGLWFAGFLGLASDVGALIVGSGYSSINRKPIFLLLMFVVTPIIYFVSGHSCLGVFAVIGLLCVVGLCSKSFRSTDFGSSFMDGFRGAMEDDK